MKTIIFICWSKILKHGGWSLFICDVLRSKDAILQCHVILCVVYIKSWYIIQHVEGRALDCS